MSHRGAITEATEPINKWVQTEARAPIYSGIRAFGYARGVHAKLDAGIFMVRVIMNPIERNSMK